MPFNGCHRQAYSILKEEVLLTHLWFSKVLDLTQSHSVDGYACVVRRAFVRECPVNIESRRCGYQKVLQKAHINIG